MSGIDNVIASTDSKVSAIEQHCIYMMATGKWPAGHKLPSIRNAEKKWGVNRLTIQRAMQNLAGKGLIERKERSGYYVAHHGPVQEICRYRYELERMFGSFSTTIRTETELSPLAVFRYLSGLAEIKAIERPELVFAECTQIQAEGHAREIENRFNIPVLPATTREIINGVISLPDEVRIVFTSMFHIQEVSEALQGKRVKVQPLLIEVSPYLIEVIEKYKCPIVMLETEESMGNHIATDARNILNNNRIDLHVVKNVLEYMEQKDLKSRSEQGKLLTLLSPRHWGSIPAAWRECEYIKPIQFRIVDAAWAEIASTIGLPLGDHGTTT